MNGSGFFGGDVTIHLFFAFAFALLNVILCYFAPWMPRIISVLRWRNKRSALIFAYLIALILELVTSPLFRSYTQTIYREFALSPFQALFDVVGVLLMDVLVLTWTYLRRGVSVGEKQLSVAKDRAVTGIHGLEQRVQGHHPETPKIVDEHTPDPQPPRDDRVANQ